MKSRRAVTVRAVLIVIFLILLAVSAHAEMVEVFRDPDPDAEPTFVAVDRNSIRKGSDGLVYYTAEEDMGFSPSAVDCAGRIFYVVGDGSGNWKGNPHPIKAGSPEAAEADFVCA